MWIRFVPKYKGGTHLTERPIANTVLGLTQEIRSRAYTNSNDQRPRAPSWCNPATPLSWNSGVLTMPGGQVRSDHPWAPGSTLMATPRRNRSLERFYFAYLTRSSLLHDRRYNRGESSIEKDYEVQLCTIASRSYSQGLLLWSPRFPSTKVTERSSPGCFEKPWDYTSLHT